MQTLSAKTPLVFATTDDDVYGLNLTQFGLGQRTITTIDMPTADPTGPTFADPAPNADIVQGENDQDVDAGKAATFRMEGSACTVGDDYTITVVCTLSDGARMTAVCLAQCRDR